MDISSSQFVKEQEKKFKNKENRAEDDLVNVMNTPGGRRVMWRFLTFCKIYEAGYLVPDEMMFREGMRNVGTMMLSEITKASPELYLKMQEENRI